MSRIVPVEGLQASYVMQGEHVFAPPAGEVLMSDVSAAYYDRPYGFSSEDLRQRYIDSSARVGGVGGGGATLAVMLAKEGVADFSIADVDKVDESNVGRIPVFTPRDVGRYKVDVVAELITQHNPTATVRVYGNGVQPENVDEFVGHDAGNKGKTVVFDEVDLNAPEVALGLHRAARRWGRYVVAATDVERGGLVTTFDPHSRYTFENYMGARTKDTEERYLERVEGFQLPTIANIPTNGTIDTLVATMKKAPLPTTLRSVLAATDLAMDEYEKLLVLEERGYGRPHIYPRIHCVNPSRGEDFVTRFPRARCASRIVQLVVRDAIGLNPKASYSEADRLRRSGYRQQVAAGSGV